MDIKQNTDRQSEILGRIIFIVFMLIPIVWILIIRGDLMGFVYVGSATAIVVLLNNFVIGFIKKKYPYAVNASRKDVASNSYYTPALIARVFTFLLSVVGAFFMSTFSETVGVTFRFYGLLFLVVGYIYFTMIQFKRI